MIYVTCRVYRYVGLCRLQQTLVMVLQYSKTCPHQTSWFISSWWHLYPIRTTINTDFIEWVRLLSWLYKSQFIISLFLDAGILFSVCNYDIRIFTFSTMIEGNSMKLLMFICLFSLGMACRRQSNSPIKFLTHRVIILRLDKWKKRWEWFTLLIAEQTFRNLL